MQKKTTTKKQTRKPRKMLYTDQTSIFDVSYKEIARRQFFAGFMAGAGGSIATLLVGFILTAIVVGIVAPRLTSILSATQTTLENAGFFPSPARSPQEE